MESKIQTGSADIEFYANHVLKRVELDLQRRPHDAIREANILKELEHENVIKLMAYEASHGFVTLTFPRYKYDLEQFMNQHWKMKFNPYLLDDSNKLYHNNLPVDDSIVILRNITKALAYIHSKGIIHRDVKPQNILLNSVHDLVLCDFGISYQGNLENTAKTCDCSTSIYKSPELLFSVADYKFEVDIWSLAILLSQLWNDKASTKTCVSKVIDIDYNECSDIRLVLTIFDKLGTPTIQDWPQVSNNESFVRMFSHCSTETFVHRLPHPQRLQKIYHWMPLISGKQKWAEIWLSMIQFNGYLRISSNQLLDAIG